MHNLEDENLRLRGENKQLKTELDRVSYKYNKLKNEYVGLMKRSVQFEMELQKHQRMLSSRNIRLESDKESSEEDIIELKPQQSFTIQKGQVVGDGRVSPSKQKTTESSRHLKKSEVVEGERLFDAFFVLQPFGDEHYEMKYCYPNKPQLVNFEPLRNRLDRFIFPDGVDLELLQDDEEESRRNEVLFGSLGCDLLFILENDKPYKAAPALRILNPSGRFFCYVFLKPTILNSDSKSILEGEIAFCFITRCPLREFFCDLNRSMQQTIKLRYISQGQERQSMRDYAVFQKILSEIYETKLVQFPINRIWKTESSELRLSLESDQPLSLQDREFAMTYSKKFSALTLSQLLHYTLVESHILFHCSDKKLLNDMFEFVRIMIRPLIWPFPVIYTLGEELLLMLQSPVPVLIGALKTRQQLQQSDWQLGQLTVMDLAEMRFSQLQQCLKPLEPSVQQLAKHFEIEQNRLSAAEWFIRSKLNFVKTGLIPTELSAFDLQFMETQVVEQHRLLSGC